MPSLAREVRGDSEQAPEQRAVRLGQLGRRRDVAPRDEQDVGRRPRRDVAEGDDQVVLVDARRPGSRRRRCGRTGSPHGGRASASRRRHHSTGFELIRNPIVPTRPAIRYDT